MGQQETYRISDVNRLLGLSCDTLRYYEKIGLLKNIKRSQGGVRCYTKKNISQLRFIQRVKSMDSTLDETKQLLCVRDNPVHCPVKTRNLVHRKIHSIEDKVMQLELLQNELSSLLDLHN